MRNSFINLFLKISMTLLFSNLFFFKNNFFFLFLLFFNSLFEINLELTCSEDSDELLSSFFYYEKSHQKY